MGDCRVAAGEGVDFFPCPGGWHWASTVAALGARTVCQGL